MSTRRLIPFRYKLTTLISAILAILLFLTYQFVSNILGQAITARIEQDLHRTTLIVQSLFLDSIETLGNNTASVSGHEFVREILNDPTLDEATRNDMIEEEVERAFRRIDNEGNEEAVVDVILISNDGGEVLAGNQLGLALKAPITSTESFVRCIENGIQSVFILRQGESYFEVMVAPVFGVEEMIGTVVVGIQIEEGDLRGIKDKSDVDLAFVFEGRPVLATRWGPDEKSQQAIQAEFASAPRATDGLSRVVLRGETFLCYASHVRFGLAAEAPALPTYSGDGTVREKATYVLLKSLDKEIAFLKDIRGKIVGAAIFGILLASVTGFMFSLKITRPIGMLQQATQEVERGNYECQLDITSNDEFRDLGQSFNDMTRGLADKERIRNAMDKVVSKEIADEMLKGEIQLGGEEKEATILFSDIRGFTPLSEGLSPGELLQLLNNYFTRMSFCIDAHHGVIDKYIGDAMMALFGVPLTRDRDPLEAALAAVDMLSALEQFNREVGEPRGRQIDIGIGINTGKLVAGNMGAENRLNYTVLGDAVNLASRLEGMCKQYGVRIIISHECHQAIQRLSNEPLPFLTRELDVVQVKGKSEGITIYQVLPKGEDPAKLEEMIAQFDQARQLLIAGQFTDSLKIFGDIHEAFPDDGPTKSFVARCRRYLNDPARFKTEYSGETYIATEK